MANAVQQLHNRMDQVETANRESTTANHTMLDMMYLLQPLGEATAAATFCETRLTSMTSQLAVAAEQYSQPTHQQCQR